MVLSHPFPGKAEGFRISRSWPRKKSPPLVGGPVLRSFSGGGDRGEGDRKNATTQIPSLIFLFTEVFFYGSLIGTLNGLIKGS